MTPEELKDFNVHISTLRKYAEALIAEQTQQPKQPEQPKLERWKPEYKEWFYSVSASSISSTYYHELDKFDRSCFENFNCFQTQEEAEKEALRTRARRKLEWLARELNKGKAQASWYIDALSQISEFAVGQVYPIGVPRFETKADAEYALSQMTAEELEALR